jgi:hypothetical protein
MEPGTIAALGAATAALLGSTFSIVKWRVERRATQEAMAIQRDEWEKTFETELAKVDSARRKDVADWQIQFLRDLVSRRVATYPAVFATLGAVIDVPGDDEHLASVRQKSREAQGNGQ